MIELLMTSVTLQQSNNATRFLQAENCDQGCGGPRFHLPFPLGGAAFVPPGFLLTFATLFFGACLFEHCLQKNETRPRVARFFAHAKNDQDANSATHGYLLE